MGELELPMRSGAESTKVASPPKSTPLQSIKLEQEEIQLPLHTTYEALPAMDVEQQPGAAQFVPDDVEIIKFESTAIDIKKEIQDIKDASACQKRFKEKYPQLDGTPLHYLEEIERLQNLYAVDGDKYIMEISPACQTRLCVSKYGPWLNLTRLNFPRRKKGKSKAFKEYIIVPLCEDGPFGNWKPYDEDAEPEVAILPPCKKRKVDTPVEETPSEEPSDEEEVISRMEAFGGQVNTPPFTPAVSVKVEEETSDSELSTAQSMESIEFDESFSSGAHSGTSAPGDNAQSTAGHLSSSLLIEEPASPESSPFKLKSASPSSGEEGSASYRKPLSRIRKECKHCGTVATIAWRNGPNPDRNRCMNPSCGLWRDR